MFRFLMLKLLNLVLKYDLSLCFSLYFSWFLEPLLLQKQQECSFFPHQNWYSSAILQPFFLHGFGLCLHDPAKINIIPKSIQGAAMLVSLIDPLTIFFFFGLSLISCSSITRLICVHKWNVCDIFCVCAITLFSPVFSRWLYNSTIFMRLLKDKSKLLTSSFFWRLFGSVNSTRSIILYSGSPWVVINRGDLSRYSKIFLIR